MGLITPNADEGSGSIRAARIEAKRLFQLSDCVVRFRHLYVQQAEARVRTGEVRLDLDGPLEKSLSLRLTALLGADNAEQIQGTEVFRASLQHGLQFLLGPVEIADGDGLRSILDEGENAAAGNPLSL